MVARLYNKTLETKEKGNEAYAELLSASLRRSPAIPNRTCGGWSLNSNARGLRAFASMRHLTKMTLMRRSRRR